MMERKADLTGESYIGDNPQVKSDREQEDAAFKPEFTVSPRRPVDEWNWSMSGTHVAVSADEHADQFSAMQWTDQSRPHAYGKVEVQYGWTTYWHVYYTNMSFHMLEKRLRRFTKDQGWDWGGILDEEGAPVDYRSLKSASVEGIGEINPGLIDYENNEWSGMGQYDNPGDHQTDTPFYGFTDPDEDMPMTSPRTCSECGAPLLNYDDWRKHVLRYHVNPDRKPPMGPQPVVDLDDVLPAHFDKEVMDKTVQRQSRLIFQLTAEKPRNFIREAQREMYYVSLRSARPSILAHGINASLAEDSPNVNIDDYDEGTYLWDNLDAARTYAEGHDADIWVVNTTGLVLQPDQTGWQPVHGAWYTPDSVTPDRLHLLDQHIATAQPAIPGPMPFIYDIESDRIFVGHPGERHSDIKGRFTPGGIVEGVYDPKGNVQIRTDTDMPYTVRHLSELWYSMHPDLRIRAIYLLIGEKKYRLAKIEDTPGLPVSASSGATYRCNGKTYVWRDE